jgi:hypothetical protein
MAVKEASRIACWLLARLIFDPEDGGSILLRNFVKNLPGCTESSQERVRLPFYLFSFPCSMPFFIFLLFHSALI